MLGNLFDAIMLYFACVLGTSAVAGVRDTLRTAPTASTTPPARASGKGGASAGAGPAAPTGRLAGVRAGLLGYSGELAQTAGWGFGVGLVLGALFGRDVYRLGRRGVAAGTARVRTRIAARRTPTTPAAPADPAAPSTPAAAPPQPPSAPAPATPGDDPLDDTAQPPAALGPAGPDPQPPAAPDELDDAIPPAGAPASPDPGTWRVYPSSAAPSAAPRPEPADGGAPPAPSADPGPAALPASDPGRGPGAAADRPPLFLVPTTSLETEPTMPVAQITDIETLIKWTGQSAQTAEMESLDAGAVARDAAASVDFCQETAARTQREADALARTIVVMGSLGVDETTLAAYREQLEALRAYHQTTVQVAEACQLLSTAAARAQRAAATYQDTASTSLRVVRAHQLPHLEAAQATGHSGAHGAVYGAADTRSGRSLPSGR